MGVIDGDDVEGDVGAGGGVSSTPGRVGCDRKKIIKLAVMAIAAIHQIRNLLRLIPLA
jgi:hypothetical protein